MKLYFVKHRKLGRVAFDELSFYDFLKNVTWSDETCKEQEENYLQLQRAFMTHENWILQIGDYMLYTQSLENSDKEEFDENEMD